MWIRGPYPLTHRHEPGFYTLPVMELSMDKEDFSHWKKGNGDISHQIREIIPNELVLNQWKSQEHGSYPIQLLQSRL
ncbi:MAG: hypothetical protein A2Z14_15940 [Chloroflexi bacterium RBG_16_48_8]|nr:MAG: hypothetical protein A2Z14_15940 [Chloroflexi bacterium RBG_16_48_8]